MNNEIQIEVLNLAEVSLIVKFFAVVVFIYFVEKSYKFGCFIFDFFKMLHEEMKKRKEKKDE